LAARKFCSPLNGVGKELPNGQARSAVPSAGTPLNQPSIKLTGQLVRADQTQQRPGEDLDQHRQELNIVITDERSNAF